MKKLLLATVLGLSTSFVFANDPAQPAPEQAAPEQAQTAPATDEIKCVAYPAEEAMSKDAIGDKLKAAGYEVDSIEVENNCYEANTVDGSGQKVEFSLDMKTGEVIHMKNAS